MPRRVRFGQQWLAHARAATVVLAVAFSSPLVADSYMDAIKSEAQKIDPTPGAPASVTGPADNRTPDAKVAAFEKELDHQLHGTYLIYKKLPPRSQREVFGAHERGASIEEVRQMVMERFLQSH
jgi:hypothetical protein